MNVRTVCAKCGSRYQAGHICPVPRLPREKLDAYGVPLPGASSVPGRVTFTVLEKE